MKNQKRRETNWGTITVIAEGLTTPEAIKEAIMGLAEERWQIEMTGNPNYSNATTSYVLSRDGELSRWEYVGSMTPAESAQLLTIGPGGEDLPDEMEESIFELDEETGKVPRDENGRPTSPLLSVYDVIPDIDAYMAEAVQAGLEAWEEWNTIE